MLPRFYGRSGGFGVCFGGALHTYGSPTVASQQYPAHRSSLKTVHRTVFLTLRPSRVQIPHITKNEVTDVTSFLWSEWRDLNPIFYLSRAFIKCDKRLYRAILEVVSFHELSRK